MRRNYFRPAFLLASISLLVAACGTEPSEATVDTVVPDASPIDTELADVPPDLTTDITPDVAVPEDTSACARGFELCGTDCVDKSIDPDHCGECGVFCAPEDHCRQGECVSGGVLFSLDVNPLLQGFACSDCHNFMRHSGLVGVAVRNTGCRGDIRVVPGDPDASAIIHLISGRTCGTEMPPQGERMSAIEVGIVRRWIAEGALDN